MKNLNTTLISCFILFLCLQSNAQDYCGRVTKTGITATTFEIRVDLSGSSSFGIGSSNIVLNYNNLGLSAPVMVSSPITAPFYTVTVTNPFDPGENANVTSINIEYLLGGTCNNSFHYEIGTVDTEIVTIQYTILNDQLTSGINWVYNGSTSTDGTVVYLCDDATQLSSTGNDNTCLNGLDALLPIELKEFEVKAIDNQDSYLEWTTNSEINGSHFEIERSSNGREWEYVSSVKAIGNSYNWENYDFLDQNAISSLTFGNHLFYRLRMIDLNGDYSYSDIRTIAFDTTNKHNIKMYPNPTHSTINFDLDYEVTMENSFVEIRDLSSRLIAKKSIDSSKVKSIKLDLKNYGVASGVYIAKIIVDGAILTTQRIIVVD
jgi:hypothetical protein